MICQLSSDDIKKLAISDLLSCILLESQELRNLRKGALLSAHQSKNRSKAPGAESRCHTCQNEPLENRCIRVSQVEFKDRSNMCGVAVVPHDVDDSDSIQPKASYIHVRSLSFC